MRRLLFFILTLCCFGLVNAQMPKPVTVSSSIKEVSPTEAVITFVASIEHGWHMYSTQVVPDGPTPTTIHVESISGAELSGVLKPVAEPVKHFEEMFDADVYYFENTATYTQKINLLGGKYEITGYLEYGACDNQNCIPPTAAEFSFTGEVVKKSKMKETVPAVPVEAVSEQDEKEGVALEIVAVEEMVEDSSSVVETVAESGIWSPVIDKLSAFDQGGNSDTAGSSLWQIFLLGLIGGLVALVTPCVWPIIPMTVSFFLKKGTTKKSTPE